MAINLTPQLISVLETMDSGQHLFITGRAGTGKSTLLNTYRERSKKEFAVLAPTGIAAVNVDGETIHHFFGLQPRHTLHDLPTLLKQVRKDRRKLWEGVDQIIIDEISMVRADLLDLIDQLLRGALGNSLPFGGKQLIAFGDLYQLPPVVRNEEWEALSVDYESPFFFSSRVVKSLIQKGELQIIELEQIYRQSDPQFIEILNAVRTGTITSSQLELLNGRVNQYIEDPIYLTARNDRADQINSNALGQLNGLPVDYRGRTVGEIPASHFPAAAEIILKIGARVMLLNNDPSGRWINGSIGKVAAMSPDKVTVEFDNGSKFDVTKQQWEIHQTVYNPDSSKVERTLLGSYEQFPLRLAWAITIHKSQGQTFERAVIELGGGMFASGQLYVALSRCRSLEGLSLSRKVTISDVIVSSDVNKFFGKPELSLLEKERLDDLRVKLKQAVAQQQEIKVTYVHRKQQTTYNLIPVEIAYEEIDSQSIEVLYAINANNHQSIVLAVIKITKLEFSE